LRLGVHVAQDHRTDLRDGNGFGGDLRHDLFAGLVELLVVHMRDHQHVLGEDQDGDVPADLGAVEVRLEVDQVCEAVPAVQGVVHHVGHQQRVKAGLLQGAFEALALHAVVVRAVVESLRAVVGRLRLRGGRLGAHFPIFTDRCGTR
jgi:hypothetical protein